MKVNVTEYGEKIFSVTKTYPLVLLSAFIAALFTVFNIGNYGAEDEFYNSKIIYTACLGISLFFANKIFIQKQNLSVIWEVLPLPFLIGFYFLLPDSNRYFNEVYAYKLIPTYLLSHLLVALASSSKNQHENSFWQYNKSLFVNAVLALIFTMVLIAGMELAILAVDKLFDFNFNNNLYFETYTFCLIFGTTLVFLLFSGEGLKNLEKPGDYPKTLKFFTQFILIPLLIVYLVILYFYSGKIILNWQLPFGWVSYLILAYAVLGILALLLVHPLRENDSKSWVKIFSKIFYFTLIPLVILLFVAIFTRLLAYGITEPRYFVLALAVWISFLAGYFIISKKDKIIVIPISLAFIILFSLSMPYFNAFSVAKRNQKSELLKLLHQDKLLKNEKIDFSKKITNKSANQVADIIAFLLMRKENDFVKNLMLENDFRTITIQNNFKEIYSIKSNVNQLFVNKFGGDNTVLSKMQDLIPTSKLINVSDYNFVINSNDIDTNGVKLGTDTLFLPINNYDFNNRLTFSLSSGEKLDFQPLAEEKIKAMILKGSPLSEIAVENDLGKYHIKLLFDNISYNRNGDKINNINFNSYTVLIKSK
jgi:hypothetical protein